EEVSGPRYLAAPNGKLSRGDKWMLAAIVLLASVLSSAITAYLTARALTERPPSSGQATIPARDRTVAQRPDSAAMPPIVIPAHAPPIGDQRVLAGTMPAPAPTRINVAPVRRPAPTSAPRAAPSRAVETRITPVPTSAPEDVTAAPASAPVII